MESHPLLQPLLPQVHKFSDLQETCGEGRKMVVLHPGKWRYCTLANSKLFSFNNTQLADFNSCFSLFKSYNEDIKGHH
jgi:hypothetical protein